VTTDSRGTSEPSAALIKFCGITRDVDAHHAALVGAAYVGVIFADSPRRVDPTNASMIFDSAGPRTRHVAVFGGGAIEDISGIAGRVNADVVQLHGDAGPATVEALRARFPGEIWTAISLEPGADALPPEADDLAGVSDAVLLDTRVAGRAGGTGVPLDWARLADVVSSLRQRTKIILAGGLDAGNVSAAIDALHPTVVDVSSGVESSPGIKDQRRMLAFAEAVRAASIDRGRTDSSSELETE
jgi:phosphoribosylanthranilate isomerase